MVCLCRVDCVCYSAYLSERDERDFEAVFKHFGVNDMVNYGTFQQLCERLINVDGDVRSMTLDVILGSKEKGGSRSGAHGRSAKGRVLLVDEVDVFFSSSFYGETYDPVVPLQLPSITELQKKAWSMRNGDARLILPALQGLESYKTLVRDHAQIKKIIEGQIKKIRSVRPLLVRGGIPQSIFVGFGPCSDLRDAVLRKVSCCFANGLRFCRIDSTNHSILRFDRF